MERLVEICCGSYEDALNAYYGRAKRIELNSALHLGGLTPSIASLKLTKKNTNLKIITMIRPRGAGFCYNDIEFEVMKEDARCMLENKADGIAFGCLNQDGSINEKQTKEMIDIIKEYQGEVVFHRAFDCVADPYASIELLIHLGVDRILTSGLKPKAMDGTLSFMVGGKEELVETYRPLLETMGSSVVRCGEVGAGNTTKLANQIIVACNILWFRSSSEPYRSCA